MPSRPRRIAAAEWESHKDTILNLRQSGVSIKGEDGMVTRMERDYEFTATPAQYELQLSKWGARKNINANEWRRTLQVVHQYDEDGIKYDVYRNGERVSPLILRKKRNQHCRGQEYARFRGNRVSAAVLPECIEIKTSEAQTGVAGMKDVDDDEDRDEEGDEKAFSSGPYNLAMTTSETTPVATDSHIGAFSDFDIGESNSLFEEPNQTMGAMLALANEDQELEPSMVDSISHFDSDALPLQIDFGISTDNYSTVMVSPVRGNFAARDASLEWWTLNMQSPGSGNFPAQALYYMWSKLELTDQVGSQTLDSSLEFPTQQAVVHRQSNSLASRDSGEPGCSNARQFVADPRPLGLHGSPLNSDDALLYTKTIGLRLSSLLISNAVSSNFLLSFRTAARHQTFGTSIYSPLILSVEPDFAGLDGVPIGSVLKFVLEQGPQMRPQLSRDLRAAPKKVSKTLAEDLFLAAIENCDAPMVTEYLKTGLVAPNDIVCSVNGRRYTAVERLVILNSIDVTKILLVAGADINKTYNTNPHDLEGGALYFAIRKGGKDSSVDMQLVDMLLEHGAEVRVRHAAIAMEWQEPALIKAIMSRFPAYDHSDAFRVRYVDLCSIMEHAVRLLDNDLATTIVMQIVQACCQTKCGKCSQAYPDSLRNSMTLAAMKGNFRLVEFLVDYVADKGPPLAGAVRSGRRDIIELLLSNGADADAPMCFIDGHDGFFTTPFAEAIRAEDDNLIRQFHGLGATTQISENGRFEAAIYAASEAGRLAYVNELLQMAPCMRGLYMNPALCISIRKGYGEIALTLLKAGADVDWRQTGADVDWQPTKSYLIPSPALIEALHQENKTLVIKIMECDVNVELRSSSNISPIEAAAQWGDVSIIEDLLSMDADINACDKGMAETVVTIAVRAKNQPLVEFLVEHGARLDVPVGSRQMSPLMAAISNEDIGMMQYLLDLGADPSCSNVINEAVKKGGEMLATVLDAVRIKFPKSQKGLGAEALWSAIERDDVELIDILLEAKFGVNAIVETDEYGSISALGMAIEKTSGSNLDIIRKLILAGGDPNSIVSSTNTRHSYTIWPRRTAMLQAILTKNKPLVELLIDGGADIKRAARLGLKRTPLQQACEVGAMEVVDLLLENGVDVNEAPAFRGGATSLQLCAIKGYCELAEKLLKLGADVHAVGSEMNGRTALDGAAENGRRDMLVLLWNATADKRFSSVQCSHAMRLAEEKGHMACCDLLRRLDLTSRPFLKQERLSN